MITPTNEQIADHLQRISHLFTKTKQPGDQYRSVAFSRAAGEVRTEQKSILNKNKQYSASIRGIGQAITDCINEFAQTGTSSKMEKLKKLVPDVVVERFEAKVCKRKVNELLRPLTEANIDWDYAGSMRRGLAHVRDVDVIVCLRDEQNERALIRKTIERAGLKIDVRDGEQKIGVTIPIASQARSFQLDLNFCHPNNKGAYYLYYTGPKAFNIRMRGAAKKKGWKLNQYGLFDDNDRLLASETEHDMFNAMAWPYIDPSQRA